MEIRRLSMRVTMALVLLSGLVACVGDGSDDPAGGSSVDSRLVGGWVGAYQIGNIAHTLSVTVDANGNITDLRRDGTLLGATGSTAKVRDNIFSFTMSDGTTGGFMLDASGNHAGFIDEDGSFGALQKNASAVGGYVASDLVGTWTGYSVALDYDFNIVAQGGANATVTANGSISGSDFNGTFNGSVNSYDANYGRYFGVWRSAGGSGNLAGWMTPDRQFVAAWACDGSVYYPVSIPNCSFGIWNKQ